MDNLKGKTICTYCNGGHRGNICADELAKKGFKFVTIDGDYEAWKKAQSKIDNPQIPACFHATRDI